MYHIINLYLLGTTEVIAGGDKHNNTPFANMHIPNAYNYSPAYNYNGGIG